MLKILTYYAQYYAQEQELHSAYYTNYKQVCMNKSLHTVYVVYLAVVLIWQFGKSFKYCQIKCSMGFFPYSTQNRQLNISLIAFLE